MKDYVPEEYFVKNRFEFFGLDIIIQKNLEPLILEMNRSPILYKLPGTNERMKEISKKLTLI